MCGICGFLHTDNNKKAEPEILKKMTDAIIHRGPDSEGFYAQDNVAIGMRRLKIIDLESGNQPIYNENKDISGKEVYNIISDTVVGFNNRKSDNNLQAGITIVVMLISCVLGGMFWGAEGFVFGLLGGAFLGIIVSGIYIMVYRFIKHASGDHE